MGFREVLGKSIPLAPRTPAFPCLSLAPLHLLAGLRHALLAAGIALSDVRLEGSAASAVLSGDSHEYVSATRRRGRGREERKEEKKRIEGEHSCGGREIFQRPPLHSFSVPPFAARLPPL